MAGSIEKLVLVVEMVTQDEVIVKRVLGKEGGVLEEGERILVLKSVQGEDLRRVLRMAVKG